MSPLDTLLPSLMLLSGGLLAYWANVRTQRRAKIDEVFHEETGRPPVELACDYDGLTGSTTATHRQSIHAQVCARLPEWKP
jgi:hypothetical protein